MSFVNVSDVDLHELIIALWRNSKPASFFDSFEAITQGVFAPSEPSREEIDKQLSNDQYLDYLAGRAIKTNFKNLSKVNTSNYNRYTSSGAFERIVEDLRASK